MNKKEIMIIGGNGGIGLESIKTFSKSGSRLLISYNKDKTSIEDCIKNNNIKNFSLHCMDVRKIDSVDKTISSIIQNRNIDVLVYSVSAPLRHKRILDSEWNEFEKHIEVQIKGLFNIIKSLSPLIKKNHKIKFIVILTEACIGKPPALLSPYVSAKYGLMGFVKSIAAELSKNNCTFNMISPGMVNTKLISEFPSKIIEMSADNNPMRRIAESVDIAKTILFLASDASDYINGVNILVNGGGIFT